MQSTDAEPNLDLASGSEFIVAEALPPHEQKP